MLGYMSADIICSETQTVFSEQITSKDKYLSIFSSQMAAIVFIILQIFFANTRSFENWEILEGIPQF